MIDSIVLISAYLVGAIPFGWLLVKWTTGRDVRSAGSGNIGATNVLRTTGRTLGILTLALDIAKGYFAVWLAGRLTGGAVAWMSAAALAVMAGHAYPVFLKFRGGKAMASFVGAFLCLEPLPLLAVLALFAIVAAKTRYISLGSIIAAAALPFAVWFVAHAALPAIAASAVGGAFIIWRHKDNIGRLRAGTEHALSLGGAQS